MFYLCKFWKKYIKNWRKLENGCHVGEWGGKREEKENNI